MLIPFATNASYRSNVWEPFNHSHPEGNTGFYFARSNSKVLTLWERYFNTSLKDSENALDDQTLFWNTIRNGDVSNIQYLPTCVHLPTASARLVMCHPHVCLTGSGGVASRPLHQKLLTGVRNIGSNLSAVHANFIVGNQFKMHRLASHKLWLATRHGKGWGGKCKPLTVY